MDLTAVVHQGVLDLFSYPPDITVPDIIRTGCAVRTYYRATGAVPDYPENPQIVLTRTFGYGLANKVRGYVEQAFASYEDGLPLSFEPGIEDYTHGFVNDYPVFVGIVPNATFERKMVPRWVQLTAAFHAAAAGYPGITVLLMDRNTQGWASYHLTGPFRQVWDAGMKEIEYLNKLLTGDADLIGAASERDCASCPYRNTCEATRIDPTDPFPQGFRATSDSTFTKTLDNYLWGLNAPRRYNHAIHPSELSITDCDRRIAYGLLGEERREKIDPTLRRVFHAGHTLHDLLQGVLGHVWGDAFQAEVPVRHDDLDISGACDGGKESDEQGEKPEGFEIKSISKKGFERLTKPKKDHREQATIYTSILQYDPIHYLYVNKDSGEMKHFPQPPEKRTWHKVVTRIGNIKKALSISEMPEPIPAEQDYKCRSCPYVWTCKPNLQR